MLGSRTPQNNSSKTAPEPPEGELDELDVVAVVPGAHAQAVNFFMRLGKGEDKERWFTNVVNVALVLICGMKSEVVLCVEAG